MSTPISFSIESKSLTVMSLSSGIVSKYSGSTSFIPHITAQTKSSQSSGQCAKKSFNDILALGSSPSFSESITSPVNFPSSKPAFATDALAISPKSFST